MVMGRLLLHGTSSQVLGSRPLSLVAEDRGDHYALFNAFEVSEAQYVHIERSGKVVEVLVEIGGMRFGTPITLGYGISSKSGTVASITYPDGVVATIEKAGPELDMVLREHLRSVPPSVTVSNRPRSARQLLLEGDL